ncbi:hypothetical protein ABDK09_05060 [Vibrio sp. CDRSL-10 TSBA]
MKMQAGSVALGQTQDCSPATEKRMSDQAAQRCRSSARSLAAYQIRVLIPSFRIATYRRCFVDSMVTYFVDAIVIYPTQSQTLVAVAVASAPARRPAGYALRRCCLVQPAETCW